jgi:uncharacterized membrane protein
VIDLCTENGLEAASFQHDLLWDYSGMERKREWLDTAGEKSLSRKWRSSRFSSKKIPPASNNAEPEKSDNANDGFDSCLKLGCIWAPLTLVALFVILLIWGSVTPMSEEQEAEEVGTACYTAVKQQLKDPSSASLTDTGVVAGDRDGNTWKVEGTGTATNSFGGPSTVTE